ncbi:type VI secretion system accessory protein TagJ [Halomonadaceae bacterium KBTZ08]
MDVIKQYLSAGQLQEAIEQIQTELRQSPGASDLRACLVELLCIAGDLERADDVLEHLVRHHQDWVAGAANLRQLLRAQQARLALREGKLADDVVATPGESLEALLKLHLHLSKGETEQAREAAMALEASRVGERFRVGESEGDIRDCDDALNSYVEGLGTDGYYYLWQWHEIDALRFQKPASPIELVWRRALIELADGRQGEAFIPLTYAASEQDADKLGRQTEWVEHAGGLVTGLGLKMYLVGDEAVSLEALTDVERLTSEETPHAEL